MRMAFPRALAFVLVCSQTGLRLAAFPAGKAEQSEKAEGKIKETGTKGWRFQGKPLSAHCFKAALAAPWFRPSRAATTRKALALQDFDRHHCPKPDGFPHFWPEARP
ncbi:hypothetical protein [Nitrobacter sp.]|uniref:hypothetical protein n=1 Tax=Nitrobacter sp. TaxID=29420 RepID=UPI0029CAAEEA|nr:hypothetical protein [Nitrobacter sp.]